MKKTIYIFGHKNPDTDCAVAATAYARLKQLLGFDNYIAARAGHFNPQTDYVFKKFNVKSPKYMPSLTPKVEYFMENETRAMFLSGTQYANFSRRSSAQFLLLTKTENTRLCCIIQLSRRKFLQS